MSHNTYTGLRVRNFTAMSGLIISVEDRYRAAAFYPPLIHSGFLMDITRRCGCSKQSQSRLFFLAKNKNMVSHKKSLVNSEILCYYAKADEIQHLPSWSSGQDVALSRRNLGFDSLWGYHLQTTNPLFLESGFVLCL